MKRGERTFLSNFHEFFHSSHQILFSSFHPSYFSKIFIYTSSCATYTLFSFSSFALVWHISSKNQGKSQFVQFIFSVNTIHIINSLISMFLFLVWEWILMNVFLSSFASVPGNCFLLWRKVAWTWRKLTIVRSFDMEHLLPSYLRCSFKAFDNKQEKLHDEKGKKNQLNSSFQIVIGLDNKKQ